MDDADRVVLVADVDGLDVPIDALSFLVHGVDFFLGDVRGRGRFRLPAQVNATAGLRTTAITIARNTVLRIKILLVKAC